MEQLTAQQLAEWEEYSKIDPVGMWRWDHQFAYLMTTISNLVIGVHGKKGTKPYEISDFLIKWDVSEKEEQKQTVEEMKQFLLGFAEKMNKRHEQKTLKR